MKNKEKKRLKKFEVQDEHDKRLAEME